MKLKTFLLLALCTTAFISCNKDDEDIIYEKTDYVYIPRKCNFIWAHNAKLVTEQQGTSANTLVQPIDMGTNVAVKDYILGFSTCNKAWDYILPSMSDQTYAEQFRTGEIDSMLAPAYTMLDFQMNDEHDKAIEQKLDDYFMPSTRLNLIFIEYRTTPIKNIKITSSVAVNGIAPGESLNSLFTIFGYANRHDFIITADKDLITDNNKLYNIPLDQFVSYHPMAPTAMKMKFIDGVTIEKSEDATFHIEITTDDGKVLTTDTRSVHLEP